ncbi:MAG: ATP-binding protein [Anaerolineales bacterium]|nr:ATP-binding protein [Anaerolineales bacterium]
MQTRNYPGRYDSLDKIREFVVRAADQAGLDKPAVYAVELAVDEACCNIIDHAYGGEDIGDIECSIVPLDNGLKVILRDHGRPFDISRVPAPELNVPLSKLKTRGVGLYLMKNMMDVIDYVAAAEGGGNVMTMIKYKR